jgi:hypothetical protein
VVDVLEDVQRWVFVFGKLTAEQHNSVFVIDNLSIEQQLPSWFIITENHHLNRENNKTWRRHSLRTWTHRQPFTAAALQAYLSGTAHFQGHSTSSNKAVLSENWRVSPENSRKDSQNWSVPWVAPLEIMSGKQKYPARNSRPNAGSSDWLSSVTSCAGVQKFKEEFNSFAQVYRRKIE